MKILMVSLSNIGGGASKVVYRLNNALIKKGIEIELVIFSGISQENVTILLDAKFKIFIFRIKNLFVRFIYLFFKNTSKDYQSINIFPSKLLKFINSSEADIVNLHWIGAEMISIKQISEIKKKIIWSLHDAWPFNGSYHINPNDYCPDTIPRKAHSSPDNLNILEKHTLSRKKKYLAQKNITFTSPSNWMKDKYDTSFYAKGNNRCVIIPNFIDFTNWLPVHKETAREQLNIRTTKTLLTFGASNATDSYNKGFRFVEELMNILPADKFAYIIFGREAQHVSFPKHLELFHIDFVSQEQKMRQVFSAGDITIVPSMSESFSLVSLESIACNTPVLAFNTSGIRDIVRHKINGYLAEQFNIKSLITGIDWLIENSLTDINESVRCFSIQNVIQQYIDLYQEEFLKTLNN